ncbi:MAG: dienelactone hydrolase [Sphingomonas sp.]|jgi:predicted dienelactone hydrolase|uniref:alpha/beta hydrolase family protein n=1 Tax=Sphingomonas sp. TaxID=28214 RepID=UPI003569600E
MIASIRYLACLLAALISPIASTAAAPPGAARNIGFQHLEVDGTEIGIWYPTDAEAAPHPLGLFSQTVAPDAPVAGQGLPLVVMSHGNGGGFTGHYDTALALARAGFVVAALTHPGDNWRDQSRALDVAARPRALSALIDYMLGRWPGHAAIDAHRIGAFGFSSGGFTVLAAAGAVPDLGRLRQHCAEHPIYFDCTLLAAHRDAAATLSAPASWHADHRIRALVVAAPALGFTFDRAGLAGLTMPIQLWRAADDHVLPQPDYADAVATNLPAPSDYHVVPGADHFDFLAPCSPALAAQVPAICHSAPGFDRAAFHTSFDAAVVAFFARALG